VSNEPEAGQVLRMVLVFAFTRIKEDMIWVFSGSESLHFFT